MKIHHFPMLAPAFDELATLRRTYEIRKNEGIAKGDLLVFKRQVQPEDNSAPADTGDYSVFQASTVDVYAGLDGGYVILSLRPHYHPAGLFSLRPKSLHLISPMNYLSLYLREVIIPFFSQLLMVFKQRSQKFRSSSGLMTPPSDSTRNANI